MEQKNTAIFPTIGSVNRPNTILYHGDCPDGFGSAFCAWRELKDTAVYIPCHHGESPPDCTGKHVAIFDFSWPIEKLNKLKSQAASFILFDHHLSAFKELKNEENCYFDLNKSGASLAWDFFNPGSPTPLLIQYVEDRDLWRWKVPNTKEFNIASELVPFEFAEWEKLLDENVVNAQIEKGRHLLAYKNNIIESICKYASPSEWQGHKLLSVNCGVFASEVGNMLSSRPDCDLAMMWEYKLHDDSIRVSLRSSGDNSPDVSVISKKYGGGGHPRASGFGWPGSDIKALLADKR